MFSLPAGFDEWQVQGGSSISWSIQKSTRYFTQSKPLFSSPRSWSKQKRLGSSICLSSQVVNSSWFLSHTITDSPLIYLLLVATGCHASVNGSLMSSSHTTTSFIPWGLSWVFSPFCSWTTCARIATWDMQTVLRKEIL